MFFEKIGKDKHKYRAKFTFLKIRQLEQSSGYIYRVKIERGSHQIEVWSHKGKKGTAKFPLEQQIIPLTLFYDDQAQPPKYIDKEGSIKLYKHHEGKDEEEKVGWKTLNMAAYVSEKKIRLEVQLDSYKQPGPVVDFILEYQRVDDDSKSVQTTYTNKLKSKGKKEQQKEQTTKQNTDESSLSKSPKSDFQVLSNSKLQIHVINRILEAKEEQIKSLKKQVQIHKKTISDLIDQQKPDSRLNDQYIQEKKEKEWETKITQRDLKIDEIQTRYKIIKEREQQNQRIIAKQRKQIGVWIEKVGQLKYKMAALMQKSYELGDSSIIQLFIRFFEA